MKATNLMYTDMAQGPHFKLIESSFLKRSFFDEHPIEAPTQDLAAKGQKKGNMKLSKSGKNLNDEGWLSAEDLPKTDIEEPDDTDEKKFLMQVEIKVVEVDWLLPKHLDESKGKSGPGFKFLNVIANDPNCESLFDTKTMEVITDYLWQTSRYYFVYWYFMPFMVLGFIPLLIMAFMLNNMVDGAEDWYTYCGYYTAVSSFTAGTGIHLFSEIQEMRAKKLKRYLKDPQNL